MGKQQNSSCRHIFPHIICVSNLNIHILLFISNILQSIPHPTISAALGDSPVCVFAWSSALCCSYQIQAHQFFIVMKRNTTCFEKHLIKHRLMNIWQRTKTLNPEPLSLVVNANNTWTLFTDTDGCDIRQTWRPPADSSWSRYSTEQCQEIQWTWLGDCPGSLWLVAYGMRSDAMWSDGGWKQYEHVTKAIMEGEMIFVQWNSSAIN